MTPLRLLIRTLAYHWRTNLAVLLGIVAGTAVITGALIVGDSVKYSLRKMHLDRLGKIDHVVVGGHRFFREQLADDLQSLAITKGDDLKLVSVAPAILMRGGLEFSLAADGDADEGADVLRVGGVMLYGVDERLWNLANHGGLSTPGFDKVIVSEGVAGQLTAAGSKLAPGDHVTIWLELPSSIPRDTLLGDRDDDTVELPLEVQAVIGPENTVARRGVGRLDLNPSQQSPLVAFVSLRTLQEALEMEERRDRKTRKMIPGRVNTLFLALSDKTPDDQSGETAVDAAARLTARLVRAMTLNDLDLSIRQLSERGYVSLESNRMVLEDAFADAVPREGRSPVLVHLANRLVNPDDESKYSMYSIVAGVDTESLKNAPFGPFLARDGGPDPFASLPEDGIILNEWLAADLGLSVGQTLRMDYHKAGSDGEDPEETHSFTVHGIVKLEGPAADQGLTPHVKGITDVESFDEWRKPFDMKTNLLTARDHSYWDDYRATPKAFVKLETAQSLWTSRYGRLTSLRLAVDPRDKAAVARLGAAIRRVVDLKRIGLDVQPVKHRGLVAAGGTTPFNGLFIGFSFFLILSATILIGLLFRLGIERRGRSIGLVAALGLSRKQVLFLFVGEGLVVVAIGGLLGCLVAVGYASLMVHGLTTWWRGAVGTTFLERDVTLASLVTGFGISVAVATVAITLAARGLLRLPARELLAGNVRSDAGGAGAAGRPRRLALISAGLAGAMLLGGIVSPSSLMTAEAFSGLSIKIVVFFLVGISGLVAATAGLSAFLASESTQAIRGGGVVAWLRLGFRNAARHRSRSVMSVALIASAAFVITAVAAGRRNPASEVPDKATGNGGFLLVAESSQPLMSGPAEKLALVDGLDDEQKALLKTMEIQSFRVKPGEESSCLNLYKTRLPTMLGVPRGMVDRGGFKFVGMAEENPWKLLEETPGEETLKDKRTIPVYPVFGDMNTLQYSLHLGVGGTIAVPNDEAPQFLLKVVGMLDASVFQGVLLMGESHFKAAFPDQPGYSYFLVGDTEFTSPERVEKGALKRVSDGQLKLLESQLREYGFDAELVVERLKRFLDVQNTYLLTFQVLGGLGLLLGTIGLATVMLRNVLERRSELALLRAVGFRKAGVRWLVLGENAFLLAWGLATGTGAALLAMSPHLVTAGADVAELATGLAIVLATVTTVGMLAAGLAVAEAVRTPVVETLRSE